MTRLTGPPDSASDVYSGSARLGRVTVSPGVPGETPTDLKSLARDDAGRDGVQSRHSEQRAVLGALHRPQSEAWRSIFASQAVIMAAVAGRS